MQTYSKQDRTKILTAGLLLVAGLLLFADLWRVAGRQHLSYSEFKSALRNEQLAELVISPDLITGRTSTGEEFETRRIGTDDKLISQLEEAHIPYRAAGRTRELLYGAVVPLVLLTGIGFLLYRRWDHPFRAFGRRGGSLLVEQKPDCGFNEVAGCDEAKRDLEELVDYLRAPERFAALGARLPRGVLLSGPPGTGKTLLARALAAEAGVPFFSLSGSDFVEMYVGVGAARIRALFRRAREQAPCIVFIDELDALGKKRDERGSGNEERENTLNQLLVELDGFGSDEVVILIGATNRPDVIDAALLRPGRFDRQVTVDTPDRSGRLEILKVHVRDKMICPGCSLERLAQSTSGMSGAELANIINEAALLAARDEESCIAEHHLHEALERTVAGPIRTSRVLNGPLRRRIAYHEAGHALVAYHCETADPVQKISIVPRGKAALGYTLQIPATDTYLLTETELEERILVLLAGRAAEKLVLGEISTGAENDLIRATQMARRMVGHFGMSASGSLLHLGDQLATPGETQAAADQEASRRLSKLHERAMQMLKEHRAQLERVTEKLLEQDSLSAEEFRALVSESSFQELP